MMMDIYFTVQYGELNEYIEEGESVCFEHKSACGELRHLFIKRKIPFLIDGEQYYDLITPYGYGGPYVVNAKSGCRAELCREFGQAFSAYCLENNVISEFVRFHPLKRNADDFAELYHPIYMRNTLGTNLEAFDDPVQEEFSKKTRKKIRKALDSGVSFRCQQNPMDIDSFISIYYKTMERNNASGYYYFRKEYFEKMLSLFGDQLLSVEVIYEDKVISAGICFLSEGNVYIHLSGTLSEYFYLFPSYVLRYAIIRWGKSHGYKMTHHGGGTSNREDDSLYMFKKQFSRHTAFDFYIGKKIWNDEIFEKAVAIGGDSDGFFPPYRSHN